MVKNSREIPYNPEFVKDAKKLLLERLKKAKPNNEIELNSARRSLQMFSALESINKGEQEFPGPHFHGDFKEFTSKHGFSVIWFNADINVSRTISPGIYIRLIKPGGTIKEEKHFPFGQEIQAEEEYQKIVKKLKEWDEKVQYAKKY